MLGWFKKKFFKKEEAPPQESVAPFPAAVPEPVPETPISIPPIEFQLTPVEPVFPKTAEALSVPPEQPAALVIETRPQEGPAEVLKETEPDAEPQTPQGLFHRLKSRLAKTRDSLVSRVDQLFLGKRVIDAELLDELEEILITADVGVGTTMSLLEEARGQVSRKELNDPQVLRNFLQQKILSFVMAADKPAELVMPETGPFVIMVVGVNGVGKTTTIGKMAYKFKRSGQSVLIVAADTFRAAAIEQLAIWGKRVGVEVFTPKTGVNPSSVVFDALDFARFRGFEVVIVDTAGRLHTKINLMEELKKTKRVMDKKIPGAPHEVLLVLDATTGQNAVSQAKLFHEAVNVTGLALTKLDGTAKGGIVVNISHELGMPIRFIGVGEKMGDLRDFDPQEFVDALFARE